MCIKKDHHASSIRDFFYSSYFMYTYTFLIKYPYMLLTVFWLMIVFRDLIKLVIS